MGVVGRILKSTGIRLEENPMQGLHKLPAKKSTCSNGNIILRSRKLLILALVIQTVGYQNNADCLNKQSLGERSRQLRFHVRENDLGSATAFCVFRRIERGNSGTLARSVEGQTQ